MTPPPNPAPILVKRYAHSRLYDPAALRYLSVDELRGWDAQGIPFVVIDTDTGQDVTRDLQA